MTEVEQLQQTGNYTQAETILLANLKELHDWAVQDSRLAVTLYKLGNVYSHLGRPAEAERFYQRSLSAWENSVGATHVSLVQPLSSLAALYLENGQYGKADRFHQRCLNIYRENRGSTDADPDSARLLHNLAALYHCRQRYKEAEALYRHVMAELEKSFGAEDWEVALVMNNLALLCQKTGRPSEAISYLERALLIWVKVLGRDHPTVAQALCNLAALYQLQGRRNEAESLFTRALEIAENALGPESPLVAKILEEYVVLLRKAKRNGQASVLDKRAQAIRAQHVNEDLGRHTIDINDLRPSRNNPALKNH